MNSSTTRKWMTKVHARRLLKLAIKLDSIPRENFNMDYWIIKKDDGCGTTCCVLGWAGMMPEFRKLGLRSHWRISSSGHTNNSVTLTPKTKLDIERCARHYTETPTGAEAGKFFFGLSAVESLQLFFASKGHRTPKQVVKFIRRLVKKHHPDLSL